MTIQLKPEQEQIVGQAIQQGLITNADEIIEVGIDAIRRCLESHQHGNMPLLSADAWEREVSSWIESFPDSAPLPDEALERESMYPDRV